MKREWILGLATAAGMSLLTALPVFGSDKNVSNIKKPSTDASKPVVNASQQSAKGTTLSAKTANPTTDVKKNNEKKNQTVSKAPTPTITSKPEVNVKPAAKVNLVTVPKPSMKIKTVSNVKPASEMKAMPGAKTVTAAKPATFVKPVVETKPVTNVKTSENAKPAAKAKTKPVVVKPITMSKPAAPIKLAVNTKPIEKTKPVVSAKPAVSAKPVVPAKPLVNAKPIVNSKPAVNAKPVVESKPVIEKKSAINAKPAVDSKPAAKSNKPAMVVPKKITASEPIVKKADKAVVASVAPIQRTNSFQLPIGWERLNLSNDQREKATAISDKYSAEIKKMEAQLQATKANRENELSALLTQEQRNQFVNSNGQVQKKAMTNGKAKSEVKKTTMINSANRIATAPIDLKKGRTQK
jgi:hypothetical protein